MMSLFSSFDMKIFFVSNLFCLFLLSLMLPSKFFFSISNSHHIFLYFSKAFMVLFRSTSKSLPEFFNLYFLSLFVLIFFLNFFSVGPFVFPLGSQISLVFILALLSWLGTILFFLFNNLKGFLYHLVPESSPIFLVPMLVIIELISNFIRPMTLTVRLVANTVAGHILMELYSPLGAVSVVFFSFYPVLSIIEMIVSIIQAYVFMMMSLLYLAELN